MVQTSRRVQTLVDRNAPSSLLALPASLVPTSMLSHVVVVVVVIGLLSRVGQPLSTLMPVLGCA